MKKFKLLALSAAVAGSLMGVSSTAVAEVTANVGATSNYVWRGTSLSNEGPAVSGGVDYSDASGVYAGIWQSSEGLSGSGETDVYVGYAGETGDVSYDVGYVKFMYPQAVDADFDEVYFSVGYKFASFYYANSSDLETDYMSLTLEYDRYSFVYGDYAFDLNPAGDYTHYDLSASLTDELSITYSKNDITGDDDGRLVISYGLEFDVK